MSKKTVYAMLMLVLPLMPSLTIATTPTSGTMTSSNSIRLGVWLPRYFGDLPPYSDLLTFGIEAVDITVLDASTLPNFDVVYVGRGGFWVHTGEGTIDPTAVKNWVRSGGGILGESEAVIYDSVITIGKDWSPQLSEIFGVWSTQADGYDYAVHDQDTTVTITDPSHPITASLPTSFATTVYSAETGAYVDTGRNPTAQKILNVNSYSGGQPYNMPIIQAEYGRGKAVYFPYCPDGYTDWASPGGLNLERLFVNAVKWAASVPTIMVYTDKYSYSGGDVMCVGLDIRNPDGPVTACVAVWITLPGGAIRVISHYHAVTLPAGLRYNNPSFMVFTLPNIPSGVYTWHAGILDPPTHKIIFEDTTEWEFK